MSQPRYDIQLTKEADPHGHKFYRATLRVQLLVHSTHDGVTPEAACASAGSVITMLEISRRDAEAKAS